MSMTRRILEDYENKSRKARIFLGIVGILIATHGTIGFAAFILEEGMQTYMFATFIYRDAGDWNGLKEHVKVMEGHHEFSSKMIKTFGWLAPIMQPGYLKYLDANAAYITAVKRELRKELGGELNRKGVKL